ncbi:TPA: ImmA/IrrE family metallo-endopeptidase [Streptococcus pneumoniae]
MTIEELVDSHGVTLAYFDNELWQRPGVYIKEISIIFINRELSENAKKRVIYHELGHLEHSTALYKNNHTRCENEANRHMIHKLLEEELALSDDHQSFNYLHFMQKHELRTVTDELMVIDEYYELIG